MRSEVFKEASGRLFGMVLGISGAIMAFLIGYVYFTPHLQVSVDVNPSIQYELNRLGLVLDVYGLDDEGIALLTPPVRSRMLNQTMGDALNLTINALLAKGILWDAKPDDFLIAACCEDQGESIAMASELKQETLVKLTRLGLGSSVQAIGVTEAQRLAAERKDLSMGRFYSLAKVRDALHLPDGTTFSYGDYESMSINELMVLAQSIRTPMNPLPGSAPAQSTTTTAKASTTTSSVSTTTATGTSPASTTTTPSPMPITGGSTGLDGITTASPKK